MNSVDLGAWTAVVVRLPQFFRTVGAHPLSCLLALHKEEEAATAIEFTLVFPVFLMILLTIIQFMLLINAQLVMSYAAWSATRSAIVVIPLELPGEGRNTLQDAASSEKLSRILRAAIVACTPISPPVSTWVESDGIGSGLLSGWNYSDNVGDTALLGVLADATGLNGSRVAQKALYASQFTDVEVTGPRRGDTFTEDAPLTVTVTHKFFLNVPYAKRIFVDKNVFPWFGAGSYQRTLTAQYTLSNEGAKEVP